MAEALKRMVSRAVRVRMLPYVVASVLLGAALFYAANYFWLDKGSLPNLSEIVGGLVLLVAIIVRFRQ